MASLSLKHIYKVYPGGVKAVNDFCMEIEDKEFIVFVGPSGCGKSTTLRMIAGLEDITAGELRIDDDIVNDFEPKDRNIAMVFQNYALYPHMSVYENMAFSLRTAHVPKDIIHEKVMKAAEILGITEYLDRKPKAMSGGQRQRVALGRAIVRNPKVFLLDEPLSNLDAKLRAAMRTEISRLHENLETTFIYVTHDQVEAMTMGTRIVVMKDGFVQQIDKPINLYKYPCNMFVAGFIGTPQMNFFDAVLERKGDNVTFKLNCGSEISMAYTQADKIPLKYMDGKTPVVFGIRPDAVVLDAPELPSDEWAKLQAVVSVVEVLGGETLVYANLDLKNTDAVGSQIVLKVDPDVFVKRGDIISVAVSKRKFHAFDKKTEKSIRPRMPKENILQCEIKNGKLCFGNQTFTLPPILADKESKESELMMPVSAVKLGDGEGKAKLDWVEEFDGKTLYFLNIDGSIMFACENGAPRFSQGQEVAFSIDMSKISVESCGIKPLEVINALPGQFIKVKNGRKYDFYMAMGGGRVAPTATMCNKLFACKGTKIFRTDVEYLFDAADIFVAEAPEDSRTLEGVVSATYDYGDAVYSKVTVGKDSVIVPYGGKVGEKIYLEINPAKITVKDRKLDIIIV